MSPDPKTAPQTPRELAPDAGRSPGKTYSPPRLRSLGKVNAITLSGSKTEGSSRRKPQG
jgi:hypothetical protein